MAEPDKKITPGCAFSTGILINIILILLFYLSLENKPDLGAKKIETLLHQLKDEYEAVQSQHLSNQEHK